MCPTLASWALLEASTHVLAGTRMHSHIHAPRAHARLRAVQSTGGREHVTGGEPSSAAGSAPCCSGTGVTPTCPQGGFSALLLQTLLSRAGQTAWILRGLASAYLPRIICPSKCTLRGTSLQPLVAFGLDMLLPLTCFVCPLTLARPRDPRVGAAVDPEAGGSLE